MWENKCPSCWKKQIGLLVWLLIVWGFIFVILFASSWNDSPTNQVIENPIQNKIAGKEYNYQFVEENKQLSWECSRSEWVYSVPNNVLKDEIEPILYQIYEDRKDTTDRTNISIYTEASLVNIWNWESDMSIWFLNDGFNCETSKKIVIKNNWDLYTSTR